MNFMSKLERKFSRYAISNLTLYLIFGYVVGYVLSFMSPNLLNFLTLNPYLILHGQIWRLVTWVLIPPSTQNIIFYVIMMLFYYQLGMSLERTWGTFRYNVYIFGGILYTVLGAIGTWLVLTVIYGSASANLMGAVVGMQVSTYYICMSIFLAFAACYPNMQVLLYFIIPIKMKWMAYVYAALMAYDFIKNDWVGRVMLIMSLLNFLIFFLSTRDFYRYSPKEVHRKQVYRQAVKQPKGNITKHKCAICGRTELDDPTLQFRFCSKCDGNYEYCQDHLFTHQHIKK